MSRVIDPDDIEQRPRRHPALSKVSGALTGWTAFLLFGAVFFALVEGLLPVDGLILDLGGLILALLLGICTYWMTSRWLEHRTAFANWGTFGAAGAFNALLFALSMFSTLSDDRIGPPAAGYEPGPGIGSGGSPAGSAPIQASPVPVVELPVFPWPPPKASSQVVLGIRRPPGAVRFGDIDTLLTAALMRGGYVERSYFAVPGGFALVTRLEQTYANGRPKPEPERWAVTVSPLSEFTLEEYLKALLTANPGYYRVLVFVINDVPFSQTDKAVSRDEALGWLREGFNTLPLSVAVRPYSDQHRCTALVYEFEQPEAAKKTTVMKLPGRLTAKTHLERAALWATLVP